MPAETLENIRWRVTFVDQSTKVIEAAYLHEPSALNMEMLNPVTVLKDAQHKLVLWAPSRTVLYVERLS